MARGATAATAAEHENEERWLLTYADMITLLMALFMVLFSISSVNISKYQPPGVAEGRVLGLDPHRRQRDPAAPARESTSAHNPATAEVPSIVPLTPTQSPKPDRAVLGQRRDHGPQHDSARWRPRWTHGPGGVRAGRLHGCCKHRLNAYAQAHGFANQVQTADHPPRTGRHRADRQAAVRLRSGTRSQPAGYRCSTRSPSCSISTRAIRSSWRATPTTSRSRPRSSRATGSSRRRARPTSCVT